MCKVKVQQMPCSYALRNYAQFHDCMWGSEGISPCILNLGPRWW